MPTTNRFLLPYPALTDEPNVPGDLTELAAAVEGWLTRAFPCTAGTRPASPPVGMLIHETDTDLWLGWDGAAWVATGSGGVGSAGTCAQYAATAVQNIANNADVVVALGVETVAHASVTRSTDGAGHKFTLNDAGLWTITATARFATAGAGERTFDLDVGGLTVAKAGGPGSGNPCTSNLSVTRRFAAASVVRLIAFQNTGGTVALEPQGGEWLHLDLARVTS